MDWNFCIADISVWACLSAGEALGLDDLPASPTPFGDGVGSAPWIDLGVAVLAADGQQFSLHVQLLDDFLRRQRYLKDPRAEYFEPLPHLPDAPSVFVAPWERPSLLVDAPYFGWTLIEQLLALPAVRRRILWLEAFTDHELEVLTDLERSYSEDDAVRHAFQELERRFGDPPEMRDGDAAEATELLRHDTFLTDPTALLRRHGLCFSHSAREWLLQHWEVAEPF